MGFGKAPGFVEQRRDVGGLIAAFHSVAPLEGMVAAIPHMINFLVKLPVIGSWIRPSAGDGSGVGVIMQYCEEVLKPRMADRHNIATGDILDGCVFWGLRDQKQNIKGRSD